MTLFQVYRWHMTVFAPLPPVDQMKEWFKRYCNRWGFQLEEGKETKMRHYQCVFALQTKKRQSELLGMLEDWKTHVSPTKKDKRTGNSTFRYEYATKEDTRIEGPWTDEGDTLPPPDEIKWTLRPWQQSIVDMIEDEKREYREYNFIYDPKGGTGKSSLAKILRHRKLAAMLPMTGDGDKVSQYAYAALMEGFKALLIDIPRAHDWRTRGNQSWWAAIEVIKSGSAYDWRNKSRSCMTNNPKLFIFLNELPNVKSISKDRWKIWLINHNGSLVPYSPALDKAMQLWHEEQIVEKPLNPHEPRPEDFPPPPKRQRLEAMQSLVAAVLPLAMEASPPV